MAVLNLLHHGLFWTLLCVFFLLSASEELNITAGKDVTLTCRAPNSNIPITVVEWSRADLKDEYVLMHRDGHLYADDQHPSFKNRVDLQDRQMKDGDMSLILKNVTVNDTGTYECRFPLDSQVPISIIYLSVDPPGPKGGHTEDGGKESGISRGRSALVAVLSVFGVICVVVAAFVIFGKLRKSNSSLS